MRRRLRLAASVAALGTFLAAGGGGGGFAEARADDASTADARALELFEKSEKAYDSGRFADAIALLRASYAIKKEPVLLYNMGRAYEGLGELAYAAECYDRFLRAQPDATDRGALETRIATLRRQLAEKEALRKKALESSPPRNPSAVPWIVAGTGAGGIIAGGVIGFLAVQKNHDARDEPTYARADQLHGQAETLAKVSNVCFIAGGVVLAAGLVWGILDLSSSKGRARSAYLVEPAFTF